jgi:hypothetical protein
MQLHSSPAGLALALLLFATAISAQQKPSSATGMPRPVKSTPPANGGTYVPQLPPLPASSTSELRDLVSRYSTDRAALLRRFAVEHSPDQRERLREFQDAWRTQLGKVAFGKLSQDGKVDYVLMKTRLTYEQRLLDRDNKLMQETGPLLPFAETVSSLHEARRRMETMEPRPRRRSSPSPTRSIDCAAPSKPGSSRTPLRDR